LLAGAAQGAPAYLFIETGGAAGILAHFPLAFFIGFLKIS